MDGRPATEAASRSLQALAAWEPHVAAFTHVDSDRVLADASDLDAGPALPLRGLTLGVKDIFDTYDAPTERGSPIFEGRRTGFDAASVASARRAGAIVIGKTVTAELACMSPGKTRNPHDLRRTPGGSSSGSAAAVAAGIVDAALGTQTAGSIARPASYCGVVGYKPTFGLISRDGVLECAQSLDTVGVLARTVDIARRMGAALAHDTSLLGAHDSPNRLRVGVIWPVAWAALSDASRRAVEAAAEQLHTSGAQTTEVQLPSTLVSAVDIHRVVMRAELARSYGPLYDDRPDDMSDELRAAIEEGRGLSFEEREQTDRRRRAGEQALSSLMEDFDVLVAPAAAGEAEMGLGFTGDPSCSAPWTLFGVPTLTIPSTAGPNGMPVGVSLVAPRFADRRLFDVASRLDAHAVAAQLR